MKTALTILFLLFVTNIYSQDLAAKIFKSEKYQKKQYERYTKTIEVLGASTYVFGDKCMKVSSTDQEYLEVFKSGIFNPDLIFGPTFTRSKADLDTLNEDQKFLYNLTRNDSLFICCFEELKALNPNEQTKRFKFWRFSIGFANPTEYYIEFYNKEATQSTKTEEFFKDACMTFYCIGTIII